MRMWNPGALTLPCPALPYPTLPYSTGALTNLTELYAHDNKLPSIPKEMTHCASLVHIDLCYNDIEHLPPLEVRYLG